MFTERERVCHTQSKKYQNTTWEMNRSTFVHVIITASKVLSINGVNKSSVHLLLFSSLSISAKYFVHKFNIYQVHRRDSH